MAAPTEFVQDGIRYVPTKAIAKSVGLSPDYLSRFCRDGRVAAVFHKGAWYVQESSLHAFLAHQEREQEEYKRKLSEDAKREVEENARLAAEARARVAKETRTARRRTKIARTLAATLVTCTLLISSVLAFEMIAPPNSNARATLKNNFAAAHDQLAAAASLPFFDALASNIFKTFCPLFRSCPEPASQLAARELPLVQNSRTATPATSSPETLAISPTPPRPTTVIQQPVIERIREVRTVESGTNAAYVDARIATLGNTLLQRIGAVENANATSFRSVAQSSGGSSSSVSASAITGTISNAISSALATITDLTSTTITATNATFTNATTTNATTTNLYVSATSTTHGLKFVSLDCSSLGNGGTLTTDASGNVVCGADDGGAGSSVAGSNTQVQFNDAGSFGADSTFTFDKTADRLSVLLASSSQQSILDALYIGRTATTTVRGDGVASTLPFASSTALTVSGTGYFGTASTTNLTISSLASGSLLKAGTGGAISAAVAGVDYAAAGAVFGKSWEVSGNFLAPTTTTYVTNIQQASSTVFSALQAKIGATASTTIDTAGNVATAGMLDVIGKTTLGSASTTNISASYASSTSGFFGNLSIGSLSGFLKATAGAISTALIDLASNVTGILPTANGGTGWSNVASGAVVLGNGTGALATTSAGTNGQVLALVSGTPTWVATSTLSTISGTLGVGSGGTGITSTPTYGQLLVGNSSGTYSLTATSSLNLNTDNLVEGNSNLFFTNARVQSFIHASTTIPKTYSDNTFTGSNIFSGALTLSGLNGPLDARNGVVGATSSIGILYGGTGATTAAGARTNLGGAASGANSDITSLSGLTTALTVAQGGTGWAAINSGTLLYGNGSSALATTTAGTAGQVLALLNGVPTWAATSTLSTISGTLSGTQLDGVFGTNGILARTTTGTYASRTLTGTSNQITVTNGDGVSGNPTLSLPSLLAFTQASSTQQSILDALYIGRTATTTIRGDGVASTIPFASTTMMTATTASTTALVISNTGGSGTRCLQAGADGTVSANASACGSGSSIGEAWAIGGNGFTGFLAPTTTQKLWIGQASSTIFSANQAWFGGTATSTFTTDGKLGIGTSTPWANLSINAGAGQSSFAIGSSTATYFLVNSSGNVGIGTVSPSFALDVAGTSRSDMHIFRSNQSAPTADAFIFRPADNSLGLGTANTERMRIDSSGNVGIGTTSPTSLLTVAGVNGWDSTNPIARIENLDQSALQGTGLLIRGGWNLDTYLFKATTYGSPDIDRFVINSSGNVGIGTTTPGAKLTVAGDNEVSYGINYFGPYSLGQTQSVFRLTKGSTDYAFQDSGGNNRVWINASAGNVGIGTTSPEATLTIGSGTHLAGTAKQLTVFGANQTLASAIANVNILTTDSVAADKGGVLGLGGKGGGNSYLFGTIAGRSENNSYAGYLQFATLNSSGVAAEAMRITSAGNVGIGTTTPQTVLSLAGSNNVFAADVPNAANNVWAQFNAAGGQFGYGKFVLQSNAFEVTSGLTNGSIMLTPTGTGGVGIGTTPSASYKLYVSGNIAASTALYDLGTATAGSVTVCRDAGTGQHTICSSDARLKHNIVPLGDGALNKVLRLRPVDYVWNSDASSTVHAGFIAQDTMPFIPEAVGTSTPDGYYSWDSNAVLSYTVKAVQELNLKLEDLATSSPATSTQQPETSFASRFFSSLFTRIAAWLADATNGITDFFARRGHFEEQLCLGETCVTPEQFAQVFGGSQSAAAAGAQLTGGSSGAPTGDASAAGDETADDGTGTTTPSVASSTPDAVSPSSTEVGNEPADAPALGGGETPADVSEGGSNTESAEITTGTDAPLVPQNTPEPETSAPTDAANDNAPVEQLPATGTE